MKVCTEIGPGPPQTPPTVQNETKTDEGFTQLQEKLRMDSELFYEKIVTIWTFLRYGTKKHQIDDEMKTLYKESHQKLIRKVTEAYEKGGGSDQALQELLKNVPIPAKFAQKTEKSCAKLYRSSGLHAKYAQTPPKVDVKALPNLETKSQDSNLNTNSPHEDGSGFGADFGAMFGEGFARSFPTPRNPLEEFGNHHIRRLLQPH